jgi:formate/nitrite transporter
MNFFTPAEIVKNYGAAGKKKAEMPLLKMLILGFLSGMFIALGAAVTNTAGHSIDNVSAVRILSGLLFPGGLTLVVLMGGELFTGNCLMCISVLEKQAKLSGVLKNWAAVYVGNLAGSLFTAFACAKFGQMNYSGGGLAVFTMKLAASKCSLPFENAFVLGVFCNILVCFAVLAAMSAKDTAGKVLGLFFPICFFVVCGFEHSVANMYYIPAGIFASSVSEYAAGALEAGVDLSVLTWGNFFLKNLLPVTLGNIAGGVLTGSFMWLGHVWENKK